MSPYVRPNKDTDTRPLCSKCHRLAITRGYCRPCHAVAIDLGEFVPRRRPGVAKPECSIAGCTREVDSLTWCAMHYKRYQAHGDPMHVQTVPASSVEKQQWLIATATSKSTGACVDWPWSKTSGGYGQLRVGGRGWRTHVLMAYLLTGESPTLPTKVVMHSCDRPACVAPWHLSWGSQSQNMADAWTRGNRRVAA